MSDSSRKPADVRRFEPKIRVFRHAGEVAAAVADAVATSAERAVAGRKRFTLVLAGGSTPEAAYRLLARPPYADTLPWEHTHVFFGDERCVAPYDPQSNFRMADAALLSDVPIPPQNVHRMRGEDDPPSAAAEYGRRLRDTFGPLVAAAGPDLVLLGMGDDAHTASLFPCSPALDETEHRCVATTHPQSGQGRLSMTAPFLNTAREVIVMVVGAGKAARLAEVLEASPQTPREETAVSRSLPIRLIRPSNGSFTFYLDSAAAGMDADAPDPSAAGAADVG